jgi:hypothetical protein
MKKVISFEGTEEQFAKMQLNSYNFPTEELPKVIETRVYVVDGSTHNTSSLSDSQFQILAEGLGMVYSLKGFQKAFNNREFFFITDEIRFINVEL